NKAAASARIGAEIVDEWFHLRLPLADTFGLELVLTEHVRAADDRKRSQPGKRLGRDYEVGLYHGHLFREEALLEGVVSHVSAPSGTSVASRVREGLDAFLAAVQQLRAAHAQTDDSIQSVDVAKDGRASAVINPRAKAARTNKQVARKRDKSEKHAQT